MIKWRQQFGKLEEQNENILDIHKQLVDQKNILVDEVKQLEVTNFNKIQNLEETLKAQIDKEEQIKKQHTEKLNELDKEIKQLISTNKNLRVLIQVMIQDNRKQQENYQNQLLGINDQFVQVDQQDSKSSSSEQDDEQSKQNYENNQLLFKGFGEILDIKFEKQSQFIKGELNKFEKKNFGQLVPQINALTQILLQTQRKTQNNDNQNVDLQNGQLNQIQDNNRQIVAIPQQNTQVEVKKEDEKHQKNFQWDLESSYTLDIFKEYQNQDNQKAQKNKMIVFIEYHHRDVIVKFLMKKFTLKISDLLIFNKKQDISILMIQCNKAYKFINFTLNVFQEQFGKNVVFCQELITKEIIEKVAQFCTVQHNRQAFKVLENSETRKHKINGIVSRKKQNLINTKAMFLCYDNVEDQSKFVGTLFSYCVALKNVKDRVDYSVIYNVSKKQIYIILQFPDLCEMICKDYITQLDQYRLNHLLVYEGGGNILLSQICDLVIRMMDQEQLAYVWVTKKIQIRQDEQMPPEESLFNLFKKMNDVPVPRDDLNCTEYQHNPQLVRAVNESITQDKVKKTQKQNKKEKYQQENGNDSSDDCNDDCQDNAYHDDD